jgi:hypothetical protein
MRVEIDVDWQHHASKHKAGIDTEPAVQSNIGEVAKAQQRKWTEGKNRDECADTNRERGMNQATKAHTADETSAKIKQHTKHKRAEEREAGR